LFFYYQTALISSESEQCGNYKNAKGINYNSVIK